MDDEFERIAEDCIRQAEQADATLDEFSDGLELIIQKLQIRREDAEDELDEEG